MAPAFGFRARTHGRAHARTHARTHGRELANTHTRARGRGRFFAPGQVGTPTALVDGGKVFVGNLRGKSEARVVQTFARPVLTRYVRLLVQAPGPAPIRPPPREIGRAHV